MKKCFIIVLLLAAPAAAQTWGNLVTLPANSGYVDTQTRQVVRTSGDVVYICGVQAVGNGSGTSYVTMFKGSPAGNPTSFTQMDSANRPTDATRIEGAECRLKNGDTKIQVAYTRDGNTTAYYVQFDTAADTWGTPESIGTFGSYLGLRYESKNAICLDSNGDAWILWGGSPSTDSLHLSHRTAPNTFSTETVTSTAVYRTTCAWDSSGYLHVAYMNFSTKAVLYKRRTSGGSWTSEETVASSGEVDADNGDDNGPSLIFDPSDGLPVVDYLSNTGSGGNYAPKGKKRTGTDTWAATYSIPESILGHSPAIYADATGRIYQFIGHTDSTPLEPHVFVRSSGGLWDGGTNLAQDSTVRDCSANIRYDLLNPSSATDIDFVTCIENYGSATAQLMYAHGASATGFRKILGRRK